MVEKLLELLVTKVDADLLERVEFKNLETWRKGFNQFTWKQARQM